MLLERPLVHRFSSLLGTLPPPLPVDVCSRLPSLGQKPTCRRLMMVVLQWLVCNDNINAAEIAHQWKLVFRKHGSGEV